MSADPTARAELPRAGAWLLLAVLLAGVAGALVGLPARATSGARTTADEPYYLMTAESLAPRWLGGDADLDIGDELADRSHLPYHEIPVDPQTTPLGADGRHVSPHDPLLPLLLAPAMGLGGWVAAKVLLGLLAGVTAVLTALLAVHAVGVAPRTAAVVAGGLALGVPLAPYGSQVYPELPAALLVLLAVGATVAVGRTGGVATHSAVGTTSGWWRAVTSPAVGAVAVMGLPWLSVKYVPVAAAVTAGLLWRLWRADRRRTAGLVLAVLAAAGVGYLVAHQAWYGGWTVYAAGDHFTETGELSVVGTAPDHLGRSRRLVGLLVDRGFGIATWAPAWLLAPAAVAALVRTGHPSRWLLLGPVAAGWATATWVALTMHGWWVPGRQVVVVLPLVAVVLAHLLDRVRGLRPIALLALVAGAVTWGWLAWEAATGRVTLVVDPTATTAPTYRALAVLMPDGVAGGLAADTLLALWAVLLAGSAVWAWRAVGPAPAGSRRPASETTDPQPTDVLLEHP